MNAIKELKLELKDREWPYVQPDHDRLIARAIVTDGKGSFYFIMGTRDDEFGNTTWIETSGGGVKPGESLEDAVKRELKEELGAEVDILCRIGVVSDYYNLIRRHNINNYFLCVVKSFGERHPDRYEQEDLHLQFRKLTGEEALAEYERCKAGKLGRLIAAREIPVLEKAMELLNSAPYPDDMQ